MVPQLTLISTEESRMAFKATKGKKGLFEVHGLEDFIEGKINELKRALGLGKPASKKTAPAPKKAAAKKPAKAAASKDPLASLLAKLDAHPKKNDLVKAGKQKDQLLRSLIPLYVGRDLDVSSGTTSKFWSKFGVKYAAPNVAKALREHVGYARRGKNGGPQITPNGIKYVEGALAKKKAA